MAEYVYNREFGDTIHSDPDTYNIGHIGEPMDISQRIKSALSGVIFTVINNGTECKIITIEDLTQEQENTLTTTIAEQKAVEDWPYTLTEAKIKKINEIDSKTIILIQTGFLYNENNFSMSDAAQRNWIGISTAKNAGMLSYPFPVSTVDEGTYYLQDSTDALNFLIAYMTYQTDPTKPLGAGRILKAQVQAATTVAEVEAVVDNR